MSTASEGIPTDHTPRTGALALLTATALGGIIAARMNKAPLVLAAGAAALALLNQKKSIAPRIVPPRAPAPPPQQEFQPQGQIEQWLIRQIAREEEKPVVALPSATTTRPEPEDDYTPQSLLTDDADEITAASLPHETFAHLTEPVRRLASTPLTKMDQEPSLPVLQALEATESCPTAAAAWILGVEPLPSLNESAAPSAIVSSMFATAPMQMKNIGQQPVFEGAALPDEIEVTPPLEPVVHLTPTPPQESAAAPAPELVCEPSPAVAVPEISVQIAAPGEASFDPPLAGAPHDLWQAAAAPAVVAAMIAPPLVPTPVIDPEIVLRPRAPMHVNVIPKTKPVSPRFAKATVTTEVAESVFDADDALFRAPLQSPREQRALPTWRSWWRGD